MLSLSTQTGPDATLTLFVPLPSSWRHRLARSSTSLGVPWTAGRRWTSASFREGGEGDGEVPAIEDEAEPGCGMAEGGGKQALLCKPLLKAVSGER